MRIIVDDLKGPEIAALLQAHLDAMHEHSPPESVHALDLDKLRQPDITFWTAWDGAALMGCGALKELDARHGEIKSMRTDAAHLRKGVAAAMYMAFISGMLFEIVPACGSPESILRRLNRSLHKVIEPGLFVTAMAVMLDPHAHSLEIACAGPTLR